MYGQNCGHVIPSCNSLVENCSEGPDITTSDVTGVRQNVRHVQFSLPVEPTRVKGGTAAGTGPSRVPAAIAKQWHAWRRLGQPQTRRE